VLNAYISQTQRLLNDEQAQFYSTSDLTQFINIGRSTLAYQSECLIANGAISTMNGQQTYGLANISPPPGGYLSAINVRSIISRVNGVSSVLEKRPWQWFTNYKLQGQTGNQTGVPTVWSMQNQGAMGFVWFWPIPNGTVNLTPEVSWVPQALTFDTDPEILGYPWTDAVPYFAAYLAYVNAQRGSDAERMMGMFNAFMKASRGGVTPEWMPSVFPALRSVPGGEGALGQ
jgi:hypothetical protein